jgi:hypothetical protein
MTEHIKAFDSHVSNVVENARIHAEVAMLIDDMTSYLEALKNIITSGERVIALAYEYKLEVNYLNQFQNTFQQILSSLPFNGQKSTNFVNDQNKQQIRQQLSSHESQLVNLYKAVDFDISFFLKLGFFTNNVVAIGSNGAGKTSLSDKLKGHM